MRERQSRSAPWSTALGPSRAVKLGFQTILLVAVSSSVVVLAKALPQKVCLAASDLRLCSL